MDLESYLKSKECRNDVLDLTKKLVEQDTTNPPGNEKKVADIIVNELSAARIEVKTHVAPGYRGRPIVVGKIGSGEPSLLINFHMDVVPPGDGWTETKPFKPVLKGIRSPKLYGRGTQDNKGPLAAGIVAIKALKKYAESQLRGSLYIIASVDEEETLKATNWYFDMHKAKIGQPTYALVPDIGGYFRDIDVCEMGRIVFDASAKGSTEGTIPAHRVRVVSKGKQAHAARYPKQGINAIQKMCGFVREAEKNSIYLAEISGGIAPNVVPANCEAVLYVPQGSIGKSDFISQCETICKGLQDKDAEVHLDFELLGECDVLSPLVNASQNMASFIDALAKINLKCGSHKLNDYLHPALLNVGKINGDAKKCEIVIDVRYLPSEKGEIKVENAVGSMPSKHAMEETRDSLVEQILSKNKTGAEIKVGTRVLKPWVAVNIENSTVRHLVDAYKHSFKTAGIDGETKFIGRAGGTLLKSLVMKGIAGISMGLGNISLAHKVDEFIEVDELVNGVKLFSSLTLELLKPTGTNV